MALVPPIPNPVAYRSSENYTKEPTIANMERQQEEVRHNLEGTREDSTHSESSKQNIRHIFFPNMQCYYFYFGEHCEGNYREAQFDVSRKPN